MRSYLDTSAFVKRYCQEEGSEIVNEIFESGNEIVTSYWTLAEATAAIDRKVIRAAKRESLKAFDVENSEERERLRRLLIREDEDD